MPHRRSRKFRSSRFSSAMSLTEDSVRIIGDACDVDATADIDATVNAVDVSGVVDIADAGGIKDGEMGRGEALGDGLREDCVDTGHDSSGVAAS